MHLAIHSEKKTGWRLESSTLSVAIVGGTTRLSPSRDLADPKPSDVREGGGGHKVFLSFPRRIKHKFLTFSVAVRSSFARNLPQV